MAVWGRQAEPCQKYLEKGRKVAVTGSVSVSTFQAQDGSTRASLEVFAEDVEFLSPATGGNAAPAEAAPTGTQNPGYTEVSTDELPF